MVAPVCLRTEAAEKFSPPMAPKTKHFKFKTKTVQMNTKHSKKKTKDQDEDQDPLRDRLDASTYDQKLAAIETKYTKQIASVAADDFDTLHTFNHARTAARSAVRAAQSARAASVYADAARLDALHLRYESVSADEEPPKEEAPLEPPTTADPLQFFKALFAEQLAKQEARDAKQEARDAETKPNSLNSLRPLMTKTDSLVHKKFNWKNAKTNKKR